MFKTVRMDFVSLILEKTISPYIMAYLAEKEFIQLTSADKFHQKALTHPEELSRLIDDTTQLESSLHEIVSALHIDSGDLENGSIDSQHLIGTIYDSKAFGNLMQEIQSLRSEINHTMQRIENIETTINDLYQYSHNLMSFERSDFQVDTLRCLRHFAHKFGFIDTRDIEKLKESLKNHLYYMSTWDETSQRKAITLFVQKKDQSILEKIFHGLNFSPVELPDKYQGTIKEVLDQIELSLWERRETLLELQYNMKKLAEDKMALLSRVTMLVRYSRSLIKGYQSSIATGHYIYVCGWVPTLYNDEIKRYINRRYQSDQVLMETIDANKAVQQYPHLGKIPSMFWHNAIVKPFQLLVTTYGYPGYNDIDPTVIVSIGFLLFFGMMFGDVGHGAILALSGAFLAFNRRISGEFLKDGGFILFACGLSSMIFGVLFGSIFAYEDVFPPLWFHPMQNINYLLVFSIGLGVIYLSVAILLNIIQAFMQHNLKEALFGHNGLISFIFYWSLIIVAILMLKFNMEINILYILISSVILLSMIMFRDILARWLILQKTPTDHEEKESIIQQLFEIIEMVMSYFTNTISFVRIGAFALTHAALGSAIFMLNMVFKDMLNSGTFTDLISVISGNGLIILLEGMVVGIQTLRLHYYEFFSKFYAGDGMKFSPMTLKQP
ncbi:MAG: hypothetical protein KBA26_07930 [Candidatus Delongbacteria bacterium]|nr:hypothetical protein [Candidatus Delongbacteria bacterium]